MLGFSSKIYIKKANFAGGRLGFGLILVQDLIHPVARSAIESPSARLFLKKL